MVLIDSAFKTSMPLDFNFLNAFDVRYVLLISCISSYIFDETQMLRNLETLKLASEAFKIKEVKKPKYNAYDAYKT